MHSFTCPVFPACIKETVFSQKTCSLCHRLTVVYFWVFNSVPSIVCQILCQYHTILNTVILQYSLDLERLMPLALFLFLNIALGIQGLLWFDINFKIVCFSSVKSVMGILIRIALNLQIALGNINILICFPILNVEYISISLYHF